MRSKASAVNRMAVALIAACLLAFAGTAAAQINTADLSVVVLDAQSVPLPGVTVEVTQAETGLSRSATTDVDGAVRVAALPPGSYTMKFSLAAFLGDRLARYKVPKHFVAIDALPRTAYGKIVKAEPTARWEKSRG